MTKFRNPFLPKFDLVVTRHAPLVEWLLREGHIDADTPVVEHAHADRYPTKASERPDRGQWVVALPGRAPLWADSQSKAQALADAHNAANVRGKHVLGELPHHLSCEAASITEVQLDWTLDQRERMQQGDLGVEDMAEAVRGLHTYRVTKATAGARPAEAFRLALERALICGNGVAIKFLSNDHAALIEVSDVDGYKTIQVDLYAGAYREDAGDGVFGEWLDPLTDEEWKVASRIHTVDGELVNGPTRLVGGYPTAQTQAKLDGFEAPDGPADPGPATFEQPELPAGWSVDPEHGNRLVSDGVDITILDDMVRIDADSQPRTVDLAAIDWLRAKLKT